MDHHRPNSPVPDDDGQNWLEVVRHYVELLQFGTVEIIVHDGRVIQIDKTERLRFGKGGAVQTPGLFKAEAAAKNAPAKNQGLNE
jgi:hypothetical protein